MSGAECENTRGRCKSCVGAAGTKSIIVELIMFQKVKKTGDRSAVQSCPIPCL